MSSEINNINKKTERRKADQTKATVRRVEGILEVFILACIYFLMWRAFYRGTSFPYYGRGKYILVAVYAMLVLTFFYMCESFRFGYLKLADVLVSQCISMFIVDFVTYFQLCLIANVMLDPRPMLGLFMIDVVFGAFYTYICTKIYHHSYAPKNLIMVYGSDRAIDLKFKMDARADKYYIGKLIRAQEDFDKICSEFDNYEGVLINDVPAQIRNDILKYCYANEIKVYMVPKISDIMMRGADDITLFDTPLLAVEGKGLSPAEETAKRAFDLMLCLIALIPFTIVMLLIVIAIKLDDHGPVFYKQKRVTKDGKIFEILKFRSMIVDAEKEGLSVPATGKDPRITRVGRFIRATRLDELGQFINILKGDMSWVGPRPERVEHEEKYRQEIPEFDFRHKVKGGLTGYAQIYGKYNTSAYDKIRLDLMYIENYSIFLDIKLIFMTLQIMVKPEATEGFDKAEELEEKRRKLLEQDALTDK